MSEQREAGSYFESPARFLFALSSIISVPAAADAAFSIVVGSLGRVAS